MENERRVERKVIQGGFWGAVTIVLTWLAHVGLPYVGSIDIPTEIGQAITVITSTGAAYWTR